LLAGWAAGFAGGSLLAWSDGLKPLHALAFGEVSVSVYTGLLALAANVVVAVVVNVALPAKREDTAPAALAPEAP
jgi:SSS family solute:Na+ symporter